MITIENPVEFVEFVNSLVDVGVKYWAYCAEKGHLLIWAHVDLDDTIRQMISEHALINVSSTGFINVYRIEW